MSHIDIEYWENIKNDFPEASMVFAKYMMVRYGRTMSMVASVESFYDMLASTKSFLGFFGHILVFFDTHEINIHTSPILDTDNFEYGVIDAESQATVHHGSDYDRESSLRSAVYLSFMELEAKL